MAKKALSKDDIALGRAVLLVTDSMGMAVEGAFWIRHENEWLYFLSTSLFGHVDTHSIYLWLSEALKRKLSEREAIDFTIYLCRPDDRLAKLIRDQKTTSVDASEPNVTTIKANGHREDVIVYRMAKIHRTRERDLARHRFGRRYKELIAA